MIKRTCYYIALLFSLSLVIGIFDSNGHTQGVLEKFANIKGLLYSQNWVVIPLVGLTLLIWFRKRSLTFQLLILLSFFITPALIVRSSVQEAFQSIACKPEIFKAQSQYEHFERTFPQRVIDCEIKDDEKVFKEEWIQCNEDTDCIVDKDQCGGNFAYNRNFLYKALRYTKHSAKSVRCLPIAENDHLLERAICREQKCAAVRYEK